ncbi:hypothetical protein P4S72_12790 [Vibrio sp. PP-XX7]
MLPSHTGIQYVDPQSGEAFKVAGIPVEQAQAPGRRLSRELPAAGALKPFDNSVGTMGRELYFVIAHDGDNSSGPGRCDGEPGRPQAISLTQIVSAKGMGVDEYLHDHPIP